MISDKVKVGDTVRYTGYTGASQNNYGYAPPINTIGKVLKVDDDDDTIFAKFENHGSAWVFFRGCEVVYIVAESSVVWKPVGGINVGDDLYSSAGSDTGWVNLDRTVGDWLRSRSDRELAEICAAYIECDACEKLIGRSEDGRRPCEVDGIGCYGAWEKYFGSEKRGDATNEV